MTSVFRLSFDICSLYTARLRFFRFHGRQLDFRQNDTVDLVGDCTIEKPIPENIGVDTKIMFLSSRTAEIEGVPLPPPAVRVTNLVQLSSQLVKMFLAIIINIQIKNIYFVT